MTDAYMVQRETLAMSTDPVQGLLTIANLTFELSIVCRIEQTAEGRTRLVSCGNQITPVDQWSRRHPLVKQRYGFAENLIEDCRGSMH